MKEILNKIANISLLIILFLLIIIGNIYNGILLSIISFVAIYFFVKKVKLKRFGLFLIIFSIITKIGAIMILKTPLIADYYMMHDATQKMLWNDFSILNNVYYNTWGYQLIHTFYEYLLLKIVNDIFIIKFMSVIYSVIISYLLYLICKKIVSEDSARIISLLYAIAIYPIYLNSVLGNQQLSLLFFMFGIYLLFYKKDNIKNLIFVGILFGLSNLERPEGILIITSLLGYYILSNLKLKKALINFAIIVFSYFVVNFSANFLIISNGINEIGLKNNNSYWKFLTGFSYETNGKYNINDIEYADINNLDNAKKEMFNRISQVSKWPNLFYQKIRIEWLYGDLDESFNVQENGIITGKILEIVIEYIKMMNIFIIILAIIGLYKIKNMREDEKFFLVYIIMNFLVYLLIEVHLRYYYNAQIFVFIFASLGMEKIINSKKLKKLKGR